MMHTYARKIYIKTICKGNCFILWTRFRGVQEEKATFETSNSGEPWPLACRVGVGTVRGRRERAGCMESII